MAKKQSDAAEAPKADAAAPDADAKGKAKTNVMAPNVTLGDGPNSLFHTGGTALMVHAMPDDYKTDPTGAAGARIVVVPTPCGSSRRVARERARHNDDPHLIGLGVEETLRSSAHDDNHRRRCCAGQFVWAVDPVDTIFD